MYSFGVFLKPLAADFHWTRAATSGAYSMFLLVAGFLYMLTGKLTDRFGPRIVMTACGLLLGLGLLLMSRISAIWQLYLFYGLLIGMGHSGGLVPLPSTVARWFVKRRGVMTGIAMAGIGVGAVVMPPVASQLIASYGWRNSYLVIGIVALVLIISVTQFLKRDPAQMGLAPYGASDLEASGLKPVAQGMSLSQAIHTSQFIMLIAIFLCVGFGVIAVTTHIVPHATDLGISDTSAANIIAVYGGLSIVGRIGLGVASDRIGHKATLVVGTILFSGALFWLLVVQKLLMFYLSAAVLGFAYGGLMTLVSPTIAVLFGLRAHGVILGTVVFIHCVGCSIGPLLTGWVYDTTGSYYWAFLGFAVCSAVGVILALLLKFNRKPGWVEEPVPNH